MIEEVIFIERRISHYGAMLKLDLDAKDRAHLNRLLTEAEEKLTVTTGQIDSEPEPDGGFAGTGKADGRS